MNSNDSNELTDIKKTLQHISQLQNKLDKLDKEYVNSTAFVISSIKDLGFKMDRIIENQERMQKDEIKKKDENLLDSIKLKLLIFSCSFVIMLAILFTMK